MLTEDDSTEPDLDPSQLRLSPIQHSAFDGSTRETESLDRLSDQKQLRYPFTEISDDYLQFPRRQLYRQNSKIAVLVAEGSKYVNVNMTKCHYSGVKFPPKANINDDDYESDKLPDTATMTADDQPVKNITIKVSRIEDLDRAVNTQPDVKDEHTSVTIKVSGVQELTEPTVDAHPEIKEFGFQELTEPTVDSRPEIKDELEADLQPKSRSATLTYLSPYVFGLFDVNNSCDFLLLDVDKICALLSDDQLKVVNESVVFRLAYRWIQYDPETRLQHASRVLGCVRFGLMTPRNLVKCYAKCQRLGLLKNPSFCEHLTAGLLWSAASRYELEHLAPHLKPKPRTVSIDDLQTEIPFLSSSTSSSIILSSYYSPESKSDVDDAARKFRNAADDEQTVLLIGGLSSKVPASEILYYQPERNTWAAMKPDLPAPVCFAAACFVESINPEAKGLYVTGGCHPKTHGCAKRLQALACVWKYSCETSTWIRLTDLKQARKQHALVALPIDNDGTVRILAIGGVDNNNRVMSKVESYNPLESVWEDMCSLPLPICDMSAVYYREQVWVCGGFNKPFPDQSRSCEFSRGILQTMFSFKWTEQKWILQTPLGMPRMYTSVVTNGELLYIVGGLTCSGTGEEVVEASIDSFKPDLGHWDNVSEMPTPRCRAACFIIRERLIIAGGILKLSSDADEWNSTSLVEGYDLKLQKWVSDDVANMPRCVEGFSWVTVPVKFLPQNPE